MSKKRTFITKQIVPILVSNEEVKEIFYELNLDIVFNL